MCKNNLFSSVPLSEALLREVLLLISVQDKLDVLIDRLIANNLSSSCTFSRSLSLPLFQFFSISVSLSFFPFSLSLSVFLFFFLSFFFSRFFSFSNTFSSSEKPSFQKSKTLLKEAEILHT